jgi:hypothetical protein
MMFVEIMPKKLSKFEKRENWEYAINLNQIDGPFELDQEMKELIEKEIKGEMTTDEIVEFLVQKYTEKEDVII